MKTTAEQGPVAKATTSGTLPKAPRRYKFWFTAALALLFLWGSAKQIDATFGKLYHGMPNMWDLIKQMFPPNWDYFDNILEPMKETIRIAVAGTTFGAVAAIPIALLSASNIARSPYLRYPVRIVLNLVRSIPDLLLAALFVAIFGIGPLPGVLALAVFSVGLIAKLTYESLEVIDPGPLEAMTAVGANKIQRVAYGVVPQVLPAFISYVLYTFEINVRAAAILGLVGAGGIGLFYEKTLGFLEYDKTNMIILFTLAIVFVIDVVSAKLRERLL